MTTPKDIEAAEKLKNSPNRRLVSGPFGKLYPETAIVEIAQALAAAREEGRRDMQDECAALAKDVAIMHEQNGLAHPSNSPGRDRCFARARSALDISGDISNLPTNAPEGESDDWNFNMDEAPKSLKELPDGAMIILAHEAPNGVWWAKTGIWEETSNRFMPIGGSWEPTAFRIITLPTKEQ